MAVFRYIGLAALIERGRGALTEGINHSAEDLVKAAMAETPVETGTLRASIHTDGAKAEGNTVRATVQTGGEASAYAVYVHEGHRKDGSHVIKAYPGGAKYIERPLIARAPVYLEYIKRMCKAAF